MYNKIFGRYIILMLTYLLLLGCQNPQNTERTKVEANNINIPAEDIDISFNYKHLDIGSINSNENVFFSYNFSFINKMEEPLIIYKASVSCGCISTEIPKQPIKKGEKGNIKVTIDTRKISGKFHKNVFVKSNSKNESVTILRIEGVVK